jgi:enoyl-CoA hydratase/carnithine racemase
MSSPDSSANVQVEIRDAILTISLHRPEKKNALSLAMYVAMTAALRAGHADATVRAVVLQGTADCFTSGNDIADFVSGPTPERLAPIFDFLGTISTYEKPVVAAVNGLAVGIGTTMLLHCDLVCCGEGARFQLPFVNLGLVPEAASSLLLPRLAGYHRAAELLMLGEMFNAATAREIGLVNRVTPDGECATAAREFAAKLVAKPAAAVRLTKSLLKKGSAAAVGQVIKEEGELFAKRLQSPEAAEAFAAFLERRKPDFSKFQ